MNKDLYSPQLSPALCWPLHFDRYDCQAALSLDEQKLLIQLAHRETDRPVHLTSILLGRLARLSRPLQDLLAYLQVNEQLRPAIIKVIFLVMEQQCTSFWAWSSEEWNTLIRSAQDYLGTRYQGNITSIKMGLLGLAYLLSDQRDFYVAPEKHLSRGRLATKVFGESLVQQAVDRVWKVLSEWGYSQGTLEDTRHTLCVVMLINRSPYLEDISLELLASVRERADDHVAPATKAISRALHALGLLSTSLSPAEQKGPINTPRDTSTIHTT